MSRNPLQQRLIAIVEPVCQAAGYELVDLRFLLEQGGWTLRVAIDRPLDEHVDPAEVPSDRVDLIDCENLSRELSAVLDVEDPIPQAFNLEVGSPGIDRPLRTAEHFQYFAGSEAKIQLAVPLHLDAGDRRNFKGVLQGVEDGQVLIECDGTAFRLPIDDIDHAKLVPDWDAVMRGKSGVGRPSPRPIKPGHRPSQKRPRELPGQPPDSEHSETEGGDPDGFAGEAEGGAPHGSEHSETGGGDPDGFAGGAGGGAPHGIERSGAGGSAPRGIDDRHGQRGRPEEIRAAATSNKEQG